ncbi:MAG: transcription-repair coupling factor [Clostridiales bacterium]|nr:transcription-repair coupling factor [Clostridiales bacterium]
MIDIKEILNENSKYIELLKNIESGKDGSCFGLNFNEISFIISAIKKQKILVVNSLNDAVKYETQLKSLGLNTFILAEKLESFNFSYFENNNKDIILALFKLITNEIDVLIVLNNVLLQKFLNPIIFKGKIISLDKTQTYNYSKLIDDLIKANYKRVEQINEMGEFSVKGDIITIFAINNDFPFRISFFDEEIEKISEFSVESYETMRELNSINICPNTLFFYDDFDYECLEKSLDIAIKNCDNAERYNNLIKLKSEIENRPFNKINCSFILPFIKEYNASIFDYLLNGEVVFLEPKLIIDNINSSYVNFLTNINNLIYEGIVLKEHKEFYLNKNNIFNTKNNKLAFLNINTSNKIFESEFVLSFLSNFTKSYNQNFNFLLEDLKNYKYKNYTIILAVNNNDKALKMQEFLKENLISSTVITNLNQIKKKEVYILVSKVYQGADFIEDKILLLGNFNIYGAKKVEIKNSKINKVFFTPEINSYCVHETFGICKCKALEKVSFNGFEKDYIILEFLNGDTLFLPTEKANLITKYIGDNENPKLNKLGTTEFLKEKNKVKSKVKEMAFDLLTLYAKRENSKGYKFNTDDMLQLEFENAFPFERTTDQEKAIKEVKEDMQKEKVMDRLVCGDVGYGKTEVALVAAYKAVLSNKQVAFLSPTTILSEQHYKTCLARMKSFMVNVEVLNRFKSTKETKKILENLKDGKIDVICGTHRLLSKDVVFKDLGLLILDEEQRFGVEDKEKIKNLKENIDVLTLSATPIPRTLHMSLIGVRDISIIDTPPKNRIPVQTIVSEYSESLVKTAIQRELDRGGQVLIVYNRVESIYQFSEHIKKMFKDVSVEVAHGQMEKKTLEDIINKVYQEEVNILISTVLIENGIDLPKANTIIITNADKLGLSQLYQLRGRVGRSDINAFAYFTYNSHLTLTEEGYKRLAALSEFSSLGSGFKIAMRDLEIRGAGEILGKQQSGHIEKVGYNMYTKLLKEAVEEIKGEKIKSKNDCKMDVKLSSFIPKDYIDSEAERLKIYEQISTIKNYSEKENLEKLLNEKYGKIKDEINNLIMVAFLKNLLIDLNVKKFTINDNLIKLEFYSKDDILQEKISKLIKFYKKSSSLKLSTLPIIEFNIEKKIIENLKIIIDILIKD